jgi:Tol biopolymer transport system component
VIRDAGGRKAALRPGLAAAVVLAGLLVAACAGPPSPRSDLDEAVFRSPLVATERGQRGGYLVFVDTDGTRTADLTRRAGDEVVLDRSPAFSPDGRWIAFASTRDRANLAETSLWLVAAQPGAEPRRLTSGAAVDRDPAWDPDGRGLVFASSRRGTFDLYSLELHEAPDGSLVAAAEPKTLTSTPTHALAPAISPDGSRVAFTSLDEDAESMSLWLVSRAGGEIAQLSTGPRDMTPAWSPAGDRIAFAAPAPGRLDADLFLLDPSGGERERVADEPLADQTGPVFSSDGRYLFATSVYRSVATGEPILSSVVVVDLEDPERVVRALHDPVAVESRVGVTVGPEPLDAEALSRNEPYAEALRDAVFRELRREKRELEESQRAPEDSGRAP